MHQKVLTALGRLTMMLIRNSKSIRMVVIDVKNTPFIIMGWVQMKIIAKRVEDLESIRLKHHQSKCYGI